MDDVINAAKRANIHRFIEQLPQGYNTRAGMKGSFFYQVIVQEALKQAQTEDPNRTSLIIAHRLSTIRSCDSICVLDKGKVIESGNHTELAQRRGAHYRMLTQNT
ncbi:unnamed protein product [Rotaria magnacalcarata]|uniref:p-glycoprotein n=2 Tax=Rotaria magnacalcarata TaxID=392030 RepID=A0A816XGY1_9BILA|nr:unnamed protein product [Rotaria magnacalcarata]